MWTCPGHASPFFPNGNRNLVGHGLVKQNKKCQDFLVILGKEERVGIGKEISGREIL